MPTWGHGPAGAAALPHSTTFGCRVQASGWLFLSDASQSRALQGCSLNSTTEGLSEPLFCQAHRKEKIKGQSCGCRSSRLHFSEPTATPTHRLCVLLGSPISTASLSPQSTAASLLSPASLHPVLPALYRVRNGDPTAHSRAPRSAFFQHLNCVTSICWLRGKHPSPVHPLQWRSCYKQQKAFPAPAVIASFGAYAGKQSFPFSFMQPSAHISKAKTTETSFLFLKGVITAPGVLGDERSGRDSSEMAKGGLSRADSLPCSKVTKGATNQNRGHVSRSTCLPALGCTDNCLHVTKDEAQEPPEQQKSRTLQGLQSWDRSSD